MFKSIWRCSEGVRLQKSHFSLSCNQCSLKGTLNSKYPTIFDVREYVFWESPSFPREAPAGQHMRQHGENANFRSKKSSEWWVWVEISSFFLNAPEWFWSVFHIVFLMFFDVLKVQEPPGNDSEWFWDRSFSHHFFSFSYFLSVECRVPEYLLQGRSGLAHLSLDM